MRKMICLHGFTPEQQEQVRAIAAPPEWEVVFGKASEIDPQHFRDAEVVCGWSSNVVKETLHSQSKLRWVQGWSAGVDKLPLEKLEQHGVLLTNASGVHPKQMSETAFALLLGLTRNIHQAVRNQQARHWDPSGSYGEIHGKIIAIIGAGEIGVEIARLSKAFGMRVLGVRRSGKPAEFVDHMVDLNGLNGVLAQSDIVVNVLPSTDETKWLFDEARFDQFKQGACFINVGRGATVKTDALVAALQDGRVASAGLDVFEAEPLPEDHPLWTLGNVILTPHIGGATDRYNERAVSLFLDNLTFYLNGQLNEMINRVDYKKNY
ncbi:D-2-hydroxyacid dehydrogenase [Paenibacillus abyssi]|uniref:3-phosphoglycerate dehydrogenase n=1 Tax=Paenibacillus abyssi TaxID=1340531 RepID=A0A917FQ61_9BACL|nr:D-2-hydroxyacid dehydrogenase [Paenibacillus abyssi]GGF95456.1 3-phosphoglycerate dehydrogenase [Paenibacillus abyssi]